MASLLHHVSQKYNNKNACPPLTPAISDWYSISSISQSTSNTKESYPCLHRTPHSQSRTTGQYKIKKMAKRSQIKLKLQQRLSGA